MNNDKVFQMNFGKVYGLLLDKATRKGRTKAEVDEVICWLTGYSPEQLEAFRPAGLCYGDLDVYKRQVPHIAPHKIRRTNRTLWGASFSLLLLNPLVSLHTLPG